MLKSLCSLSILIRLKTSLNLIDLKRVCYHQNHHYGNIQVNTLNLVYEIFKLFPCTFFFFGIVKSHKYIPLIKEFLQYKGRSLDFFFKRIFTQGLYLHSCDIVMEFCDLGSHSINLVKQNFNFKDSFHSFFF